MKNPEELINDSPENSDTYVQGSGYSEMSDSYNDGVTEAIVNAKQLVHDQLADIEFINDNNLKKQVMVIRKKGSGETILETTEEGIISQFFDYARKENQH